LESALKQFTMWLPKDADMLRIWGNGANFDNALLAAMYRAAKMEAPWHYWNDRCYRTIAAMFMKTKVERVGTGHNALDDATTQALRLLKMQEEAGFNLV
jgi:exodeoxyribonuclease VIII